MRAGDRWGSLGRRVLLAAAVAVVLAFLGYFFVWPVIAIMARGLVPDGSLDLGAFAEVLSRPRIQRAAWQTLAQASCATVLAVAFGVPGAKLLYRRSFRGRRLLRALVAIPFVLPTVVVGVAFRSVVAPSGPLGFLGADQTFWAILAALVFFNYSVVVRTVGSAWENLGSRQEEAAAALGASGWRIWWTVTLPRLAPSIAAAAAIVFLFCATAFGVVLTLGGVRFGTIETEIWIQTTQFLDLRTASVLSVVQFAFVALILIVTSKLGGRNGRAQQVVGTSSSAPCVGRRDLGAVAVTGLVVVVLLGIPLVTLVVRSLQTAGGWGLGNYAALFGAQSEGSTSGSTIASFGATPAQALVNSLTIGLDATIIAVVLGCSMAVVLSRRTPSRAWRVARGGLDGFLMLPLGVSAVTVGFGFLVTLAEPSSVFARAGLSAYLVPIAQAMVAIPLVVRTTLPAMRAIDQRQRESAAVLGAPPWRVFVTIDLPVLLRGAAIAAGFAFAISLGEFGATSFLARPGQPTLPVLIYRLISRPGADNLGMALAASVVLAVVVAVAMAASEALRSLQGKGFRARGSEELFA